MDETPDRGFVVRVLVKALLLFAAANLVFALLVPAGANAALGRVSLYNSVFPGRARFPFGENPEEAYNLSLYNLDAMFASHQIERAKAPDELRVVIIGDSSVWGTLLEPGQTLAGQINAQGLQCGGRRVTAYNLGYPTISLVKDVMILRRVLNYAPDLIVWPTTLEAFPRQRQLDSPLAANNVAEIAGWYAVEASAGGGLARLADDSIAGQRRALADLVRLQAYGVMWAATGIDQAMPERYTPAAVDLEADEGYHGWLPFDGTQGTAENPTPPFDGAQGTASGSLPPAFMEGLAFDVLAQGIEMAGSAGVPVLLVNEPMLISQGENSDVRYNFFYPRWAYDEYRRILQATAEQNGWRYLDAWDLIPGSEFTNSAVHLSPRGSRQFAQFIADALPQIMTRP